MASTERALRQRMLRDLALALGAVLAAGVLFTRLDVVEQGAPLVAQLEAWELDDLLLTLAFALCAAVWFALRRVHDAGAQLAALRHSERLRAGYAEQLERLSTELLSTEERERQRVANVLHDRVGQTLYAARLKLELAAADPRAAADTLEAARALVDEAMAASKELTVELSPPVLRDLGLREAVRWQLQRLEARYGFRGVLDDDAAWDRIPERFHDALFASVSELVVNAGKHARANSVRVAATQLADDQVTLTVVDDGAGFDPSFDAGRAERTGFGLFSIERRLSCMGGTLAIESAPAAGTSAVLRIAL